jgi:hypothetical protein
VPEPRMRYHDLPYFSSHMLTFAESVNLGVLDGGLVASTFCVENPNP